MTYSIIIPTYNSERTIKRCLDSIVEQTFSDWEVLLMDGVSKDSTLEIARSYNDSRIRIYSEPDKGIYDAMNKGIEKSKGEWLYFLGSDDYLYDAKVLENVSKELSDGYDVVYGESDSHWSKMHRGEWTLDKIEANRVHQAIFYNRNFFGNSLRYNLKYKICADYDMNMKWFLNKKYKHEYIPVVVSHMSEGGVSSQVNDDAFSRDFGLNMLRYNKHVLTAFYKRRAVRVYIAENPNHKILNIFLKLYAKIMTLIIVLQHWYIKKLEDLQKWKARHRIFSWPAYGRWLEDIKRNKSQFVPFTSKPYIREKGDAKIFAYYLTQYHSIPENDAAHGKGFTEWTNVASAQPQFVGHYQPKVPYDLGFYNLTMPGVMERQVEIAKAYGIYGFCFYYYWFSGKKVLEKPIEYWLAHKEIDFHYHFCWANENWSKLWDGGNKELIFEQKLQDGDAEKFFNDILPYFKDERYEKNGNRPILLIYRPQLFEKDALLPFLERLNSLAVIQGFDGICFLSTNAFGFDEPLEYGFEGLVEFPPHYVYDCCPEILNVDRLIPTTDFTIADMSRFFEKKLYLKTSQYPVFRACFPSWDNTPRKAWSKGVCYKMSDENFATWLRDIIQWTMKNHSEEEMIVYINAWNEWGEGAILEPTLRYGYKYLDIVKKCVEQSREDRS